MRQEPEGRLQHGVLAGASYDPRLDEFFSAAWARATLNGRPPWASGS